MSRFDFETFPVQSKIVRFVFAKQSNEWNLRARHDIYRVTAHSRYVQSVLKTKVSMVKHKKTTETMLAASHDKLRKTIISKNSPQTIHKTIEEAP